MLQIMVRVGCRKRVDQRRLRLGDYQKIGLVDRAPAHDTRPSNSSLPSSKRFLGECVRRNRKCCQTPGKSMNRRSDCRDLALPIQCQNFFGSHATLAFRLCLSGTPVPTRVPSHSGTPHITPEPPLSGRSPDQKGLTRSKPRSQHRFRRAID